MIECEGAPFGETSYRGFITTASVMVVCRKLVCGSPMAQTLKTRKGHRDLSWFGPLSPMSNSIVIILLGMLNQGIRTVEIGRVW